MFLVKNKRYLLLVLVVVFASFLALNGIWKLDQKNRDIERKADLEKIQFSLEKFYEENGEYPPQENSQICVSFKETPDLEKTLITYLEKPEKGFPHDPKFAGTNKDYFYRRLDQSSFKLYAELERKEKNNDLYLISDCSQNQNKFDYIISEIHQMKRYN